MVCEHAIRKMCEHAQQDRLRTVVCCARVRRATLLLVLSSLQVCTSYAPAPSLARCRLLGGVLSHDGRARRRVTAHGKTVALRAQQVADAATASAQASAKVVAAAIPKIPNAQVPTDLAALQTDLAGMYAASPVVATAVGAFAVVLALAAASSALPKSTSSPYPRNTYDAMSAAAYYNERPALFLQRAAFITLSAAGFGFGLLLDVLTGTWKQNEGKRADELTDLLTRLGPTFIKIGQSLSIRTDLLTPEYLRSLTALQDKVPEFPTDVAREIISRELGKPCDTVFSGIDKPVAAASLGQVYKAQLKDGRQVAVKVQRPDIVQQVALDMHLIRTAAPLIKALGAPGDIEGLVDDWGFGFVNELDYIQEANNADIFMEGMKSTPLAKVVFAPPVLRDFSAQRVLTSEWIDGERLEKSNSDDVTTLCSVAMNTYLTMMLQTGTMHCDPHPGNLLRTPDGRLCILDWGLVQEMPPDLRLTMIEHIAHLVSRDYAKVPNDLVLLGFVPEGQEAAVKSGDSMRVIAETYTKLMSGGGAANIDVNAVFSDLQDLTSNYGALFQIPPYFAYIARAFGVLEGIGLTNDPDYAIITECLPYISQRLLTDPNPRTAGALNTFIFGASKDDPDRLINTKRVQQLVEGFGSYSTAAAGLGEPSRGQSSKVGSNSALTDASSPLPVRAGAGSMSSMAITVEKAADQLFELLITEESTPLQAIVLEQLARLLNAGVRGSWKTLRDRSGRLPGGRSVLGTVVDPFGIFANSDLVALDQTDKRALAASQSLVEILQKQTTFDTASFQSMTQAEQRQVAVIVTRKIWDNRRVIALTTNRLAVVALLQTLDRLEKGAASRGGISSSTLRRVEDRLESASARVEQRLKRPSSL